MPNPYFQFKQFTIQQDRCAMKVTTDSCLFGAWCAFQMAQLPKQPRTLLDIGTGTGLLSLMIAQQLSTHITTVEIDSAAARQATGNVFSSPYRQQIQVINKDILHYNTTAGFDCIVSNPPFYENDLKAPDEAKNRAHHSTVLSLASLLSFIKKMLSEDGQFFLLLPFYRKQELYMIIEAKDLALAEVVTVRSSSSHPSFRLMIKGRHKKGAKEILNKELCIKNELNNYSPEFTALLKDYYLYL